MPFLWGRYIVIGDYICFIRQVYLKGHGVGYELLLVLILYLSQHKVYFL